MANRKRDIMIRFRVNEQEQQAIKDKMATLGTSNMGAYLRKMALNGYIVKLDLPQIQEMLSLLRRSSNNLNQLTRRVHETGRIYDTDLVELQKSQDQILTMARDLLQTLSVIR